MAEIFLTINFIRSEREALTGKHARFLDAVVVMQRSSLAGISATNFLRACVRVENGRNIYLDGKTKDKPFDTQQGQAST